MSTKFPKLTLWVRLITVLFMIVVFVAPFALQMPLAVTPAAAAPAAGRIQPHEPSGKGTFCAGTGPLVFEQAIPGKEWKCNAEGTYTVVQPWHSPGGDYNPKLDIVNLTIEQATSTMESNDWNSGSYWFVPGGAAAPAAPAAPSDNSQPSGGLVDWLYANWLWCPGLIVILVLLVVAFVLGRRGRS